MTRTEQVLAAYPDAVTKFPGWWESETRVRSEERGDHSHGSTSGYWVDVQYLELRCIAPDLTKPENLHHLLALADAVDDDGLSETDTSGGIVRHHILRNGKGYFGTGGNAGAPGARTDAAFNALEKALGVKV